MNWSGFSSSQWRKRSSRESPMAEPQAKGRNQIENKKPAADRVSLSFHTVMVCFLL